MKLRLGVAHFVYLWKGAGWAIALRHAAMAAVSLVYLRKRWYLTMVRLDPRYVTPWTDLVDKHGTRTVIVRDPKSLEAYAAEFGPQISYSDVRSFLEEPGERFVAIARRPQPGGTAHEVVGYRLCERGRFGLWDGKVDLKLGPEFFCVYNKTVAPRWRGQNVSEFMRRGLFDHCRREGMRVQVGMIGIDNTPSIRSFYKRGPGYTPSIIGVIQRVRIFRKLIDRHTPVTAIRQLVVDSDRRYQKPSRFEARMALLDPGASVPGSPSPTE